MSNTVFIIPGFNGSGPTHWQSWLEARLPGCVRLRGVDWAKPDLGSWVDQAQSQLQAVGHPAYVVAHSFGCLVAATLAGVAPELVKGIVFVAPAEPRRFAVDGGLRSTLFEQTARELPSLVDIVPHTLPRSVRSIILASENDPWLSFPDAEAMAEGWHSHFLSLGEAGHVNPEAGYGAWPGLLRQLEWLIGEGPDNFYHWTRRALERSSASGFDETEAKTRSKDHDHGLLRFAS